MAVEEEAPVEAEEGRDLGVAGGHQQEHLLKGQLQAAVVKTGLQVAEVGAEGPRKAINSNLDRSRHPKGLICEMRQVLSFTCTATDSAVPAESLVAGLVGISPYFC